MDIQNHELSLVGNNELKVEFGLMVEGNFCCDDIEITWEIEVNGFYDDGLKRITLHSYDESGYIDLEQYWSDMGEGNYHARIEVKWMNDMWDEETTNGINIENEDPQPIYGCTDSEANNYQSEAEEDDGSCTYDPEPVYGCTDNSANNYNPEATEDDNTCEYDPEPVYGCMDDSANNYNPDATVDDESCEYDPEPECEVEITNHYRGHVQSDAEQDAILIAFRIVPTDCDGDVLEIDIDMHPPGEDDEVDYTHFVQVNGSEPTDVSHTFDNVAVGVWVPRITAAIDDEPIERIWMWSIEVVEQVCEINLYGINFGTNNTSAVVIYDLDCGDEENDLDGYNVSVQFLVYSANSTNNTNPPIEYNTTTHYIQGYADDPRMLRLSNFTDGNTTIYDFYWYVTWVDADGEVQYIERTWLNRELVA